MSQAEPLEPRGLASTPRETSKWGWETCRSSWGPWEQARALFSYLVLVKLIHSLCDSISVIHPHHPGKPRDEASIAWGWASVRVPPQDPLTFPCAYLSAPRCEVSLLSLFTYLISLVTASWGQIGIGEPLFLVEAGLKEPALEKERLTSQRWKGSGAALLSHHSHFAWAPGTSWGTAQDPPEIALRWIRLGWSSWGSLWNLPTSSDSCW